MFMVRPLENPNWGGGGGFPLIICSTRLTSRTVSDFAWSGARQKLENKYCTGLPSKGWRTEIKPKAYIAANDF
jgi:hypothetical protein